MSLVQDLRQSLRQLARHPVFTLTAVLTLALGMGVNVVAFTVINGLLFRGSAASVDADVGRLATTRETPDAPIDDDEGNASEAEFERFAAATRGVLHLTAEGRERVAWRHDGATETAWALFVAPGYFPLVNVRPVAGRLEVSRGLEGPASVAIGERFWRRALGGASLDTLTLTLNGVESRVTGVVPDTFTGPAGLYSPDVWLPLDDRRLRLTGATAGPAKDVRWLFLFGRPAADVSAAEVQGRVEAAAAAMASDWPATHAGRGARFRPIGNLGGEKAALSAAAAVAMGIIGLVLLLACFNVANLLLARAVERERDMAIRAALGAGAGRLVRLMIGEGLVIALLAGAVALVLSWWTQVLVGSFAIPIDVPQHLDLRPDGRVVLFVGGLVLVAGILPGLWPALTTARVDVLRVLGSQGGSATGARPSPLRRWLVALQMAGSTAFLAIAALFIQSYGQMAGADLGFDRDRLVVAEFDPAVGGEPERYTDALIAAVTGLPGVGATALADRAPYHIGYPRALTVARPETTCGDDRCASYPAVMAAPGYFRAMGIALTGGRDFTPGTAAEVIVNQPLADRLWPEGEAVGRAVTIGDARRLATVVGIAAPAQTRGFNRTTPELFVPLDAAARSGPLSLIVRTELAPELLVPAIRQAARAVDTDVSRVSVKTMAARRGVQLWPVRTISWLFATCGLLAVVLATSGLAAVVLHATSRRTREFGIRMALGATGGALAREVLGGSARLLLPGALLGAVLAGLGAHLARAAFVGVNVLDPRTYVAVLVIEAGLVLLACTAPARRAGRVDPLTALRAE